MVKLKGMISRKKRIVVCLMFLAFSTYAYANPNDGFYNGSMISTDCGTGSISLTITNGQVAGSLTSSGTSYTLTGGNDSGTSIDFYAPANAYFFAGTISNGLITGSYMTKSGTVCTGVSYSLSRVSSDAGDSEIVDLKTFNAVQELNSRKEVTDKIVTEVFVNPQPKLTPGNKEVSPGMTMAADYKYVNIPLSYSFSESLKITGELPVIYHNEDFYLGNLSGIATHYSGDLNDQLVLTTLQMDLPTGDEEIGGGGINVQAGQSRVFDIENARVFVSYLYRYTSEVDELNTGDTLNLAAGIDFRLGSLSLLQSDNVYGIVTLQNVTESQYDSVGLNDDKKLLDLTLGLIWTKWRLRAGLSVPVMTISDQINNSDRLASMDVGYRWGL